DPSSLPRIWWAPGGLLGSLPLHAAGVATDGVIDRVVSSYTPTISALRYARRPLLLSERRALVVTTQPGFRPPALLTGASAPAPTSANVLSHLPLHPIVHFACHGWTD